MADIVNGNGNGNGFFARLGKYSWMLTVIAMIMGPFGSYMLFRQEMLVEIAQINLQISQNKSEIDKMESMMNEMVPKSVHETRWEMQKEIDRLHEKMEDDRFRLSLDKKCER